MDQRALKLISATEPDEWISETGQSSGDPNDFIDWAVASRRLAPRPQDIRQILRKQVTQALRQAKRFDDEVGFTYRAKQCVMLFEDSKPQSIILIQILAEHQICGKN